MVVKGLRWQTRRKADGLREPLIANLSRSLSLNVRVLFWKRLNFLGKCNNHAVRWYLGEAQAPIWDPWKSQVPIGDPLAGFCVAAQCSRQLGGGGGLRQRNSKSPREQNQKGSHGPIWDPLFSRLMHPLPYAENANGTGTLLAD